MCPALGYIVMTSEMDRKTDKQTDGQTRREVLFKWVVYVVFQIELMCSDFTFYVLYVSVLNCVIEPCVVEKCH